MKKEKDFIHPALDKKDTVVINLRKVPAPLHRALTIAALDAGKSMEQFIVDHLKETMP